LLLHIHFWSRIFECSSKAKSCYWIYCFGRGTTKKFLRKITKGLWKCCNRLEHSEKVGIRIKDEEVIQLW